MKVVFPFVVVVVGIVLLLLGIGWSSLIPAGTSWTPEMNEKLTAAETDLRSVGFRLAEAKSNPQMHSGEGVPVLQAKHDEIKKEYDTLFAEFKTARDAPATTGGLLRWIGIGAVALGAVLVFLNKPDA